MTLAQVDTTWALHVQSVEVMRTSPLSGVPVGLSVSASQWVSALRVSIPLPAFGPK